MPSLFTRRPVLFGLVATAALAALSGCAGLIEPRPNDAGEKVVALTRDGELITVDASWPWWIKSSKTLRGLPVGEVIVGIDYRVARGELFALGRTGQLYRIDAEGALLTPVGSGRLNVPMRGTRFAMNFNPVADRIRVVSDQAMNLRLHPDTGAVIDFDPQAEGVQTDPALVFAPGDPQHGTLPQVVAVAYTYNNKNDKLTTNYAIDARLGTLVTQGSVEGEEPVESPNLGILRTVGELGAGPIGRAAFDISDTRNTPLAALQLTSQDSTRLYRIDLRTGKATLLGTLGHGKPVVGMAVQP